MMDFSTGGILFLVGTFMARQYFFAGVKVADEEDYLIGADVPLLPG
ncbi:MAG: hypothetical protein SCH71_08950 [Desulfobulbaceae bacterium]|nr:hypothetical protein [Desulfobulbaceae bacterium]